MRVCIAGCGTMGSIYAGNLSKMQDVELVAVFDTRQEKAQSFGLRYQSPAYTSFNEMIANENPDVVCVTMPTFLHKEYVIKAAEFGKHVICEKPISTTLSEAREMIRTCEQKQVKLFVGHVVRFFPEYRDLQRQVRSGAIGEIGVAHAKRLGPHPGTKGWYGDPAKSGGVIMDLMIHDIDFMRWTIGEVKNVFTVHKRLNDIDYALLTLRFQNGAIANLEGFWGYPGEFSTSVELAGKKGILRWDSKSAKSLTTIKKSRQDEHGDGAEIPQSPSIHDPYFYEIGHFLRCIQNGQTPIVTVEDAYKALEIVYAAIDSANTGLPVKLGEKCYE